MRKLLVALALMAALTGCYKETSPEQARLFTCYIDGQLTVKLSVYEIRMQRVNDTEYWNVQTGPLRSDWYSFEAKPNEICGPEVQEQL